MRRWQVLYYQVPRVSLSSFLAVCAWVVVMAYESNEIGVSFGCFDPPQFGGIERDVLVVGMTSERAPQLVQ